MEGVPDVPLAVPPPEPVLPPEPVASPEPMASPEPEIAPEPTLTPEPEIIPEASPSPRALTEDELWEQEIRNKVPTAQRRHMPVWPGRFVGFRFGFGIGSASIPQYSPSQTIVPLASVGQFAPFLGVEVGYVPPLGKLGVSVSFEYGLFLSTPDFLQSAPSRMSLSIGANYVPTRRMRLFLGFTPFTTMRITPYGVGGAASDSVSLQGNGLRAGVHLRSRQPSLRKFEAFAVFSWDHFINAESSRSGHPISDSIGPDFISQAFYGTLGIQYNLNY